MTHVNESYCTALGKRTSMWIHELCVCVYMQKNTLHRYTHIYVVKTTHLYKKENTPFYVCVYLRNFFCLHVCTHIKFISTHQNSFRVLCDMTRSHESCLTHMSHALLIWVMPDSYESCLTHMSHASLIWVTSSFSYCDMSIPMDSHDSPTHTMRCNTLQHLQHTLQQSTIVIPLWKDSSYE